jgi:8-oxo-dGTP pyrophosphatase MutT (NUDIX family)
MKTRASLEDELARHQPFDRHELKMLKRISAFVGAHADCFERSLLVGHVTGSAWVLDEAREYALLTHHAKLDKWLQPGGHCDGEADVSRVAMREVQEEAGLDGIRPLLDGAIFDVDAHDIPARGNEPAHVHYDIRYAFEADRSAPLRISAESKDLRWVALDRIAELNTDESVLRMVRKTAPIGTREGRP